MTESDTRAPRRDGVATLVFAAILLTVLVYHIVGYYASQAIRAPAEATLFAKYETGTRLTPIPGDTGRVGNVLGLAANPLNQAAVNDLVVAQARVARSLAASSTAVGVVAALGWRYTPGVQNMMWRAAKDENMSAMLDGVDGLMRRQQIVDSAYVITDLMTTDDGMRARLAARLVRRPPWRLYYLMSANELTDPRRIVGRAQLMSALQRRGDRLERNEVAPILPVLGKIGRWDTAFALWRAHQGDQVERPLADPTFAAAGKPIGSMDLPVVFEWQLNSGPGFYSDAQRDDRGSYLFIGWDGRGSPTFLSQQTTALRGRFVLVADADGPAATIANTLSARLVCGDGAAITLSPTIGIGPARFVTPEAIPCDYPRLELVAAARRSATPASLVLRKLALVRLG